MKAEGAGYHQQEKARKGRLALTKARLREKMKLMRDLLPEDERVALNRAIYERLLATAEYVSCSRLFTYVSFGSEADTSAIIADALNNGKEVYAPRVEGRDMSFYRITGISTLITSRFGIPEPDPVKCAPYVNNEGWKGSRLMLLPGLAFDTSGCRVGYGAGYYDRFLSLHREDGFIKLAPAYDFQVVRHICCEEYDIRADLILTPHRMINCRH